MEKSSTFTALAKKQADLFQSNNLAWMNTMVTSWTIQEIMRQAYEFLVRAKMITKLEEMEDKASIFTTVDEFYKGEPDEKIRTRIAVSLITLEYYLQ